MSGLKTIVLSRTDKIGDFIVSIPSFATVKAMYPEAKVVALVSNSNEILAKSLDCIDATLNVDQHSDEELISSLRALQPDAFIALVTNSRIGRLARKSGAAVRIGPYSKLHSFFSYSQGLRQSRSKSIKSEAEYNLDLVRHLDPQRFDEVGIHFERIKYSETHAAEAETLLKQSAVSDQPFVLLNPNTGGSGRNLKNEDYSRFISSFLESCQQDAVAESPLPQVVLFGMPQQAEALEGIKQAVPEAYRQAVKVVLNTYSLLTAAAFIDRCQVFIGPSTGTTHIAGNYHKPTLCFFSELLSNCFTRWQLFGDPDQAALVFIESKVDKETKLLQDFSEEQCHEMVLWCKDAYFGQPAQKRSFKSILTLDDIQHKE